MSQNETEPVSAHVEALRTLDAQVEQLHRRALRCITADPRCEAIANLLPEVRPVAAGHGRSVRIALMGSSQAGKSTLLDVLAGQDSGRRGVGFTNTSTDLHTLPVAEVPGADVIDTPGIGTMDSELFEPASMETARTADLVIWVQPNDALLPYTEARLQKIACWGRRVLVAVNVKWDIDSPKRRKDFLKRPERAFREAEDHIRLLQKKLAAHGTSTVAAVALHAKAARLGTLGEPAAPGDDPTERLTEQERQALKEASRLPDLLHALQQYAHPTPEESIRADAQQARAQAGELQQSLTQIEEAVREQLTARRIAREQAEQSSSKVLGQLGARMDETVARLSHRLADWTPADFDSAGRIRKKWRKLTEALTEELSDQWEGQISAINDALQQPVEVDVGDAATGDGDGDPHFRGVRGLMGLRLRKVSVVVGHRLTRAGILLGSKTPWTLALSYPARWGVDKLRNSIMPEITSQETLIRNREHLRQMVPAARSQQQAKWRSASARVVRELGIEVNRQLAERKEQEQSVGSVADTLADLAQLTQLALEGFEQATSAALSRTN